MVAGIGTGLAAFTAEELLSLFPHFLLVARLLHELNCGQLCAIGADPPHHTLGDDANERGGDQERLNAKVEETEHHAHGIVGMD